MRGACSHRLAPTHGGFPVRQRGGPPVRCRPGPAGRLSTVPLRGPELFGPLGITEWYWPTDPDGYEYGFGHLRLSAEALGSLGELWLGHGRWRGRQIMDEAYAREMATAQTAGGPPEHHPYGYLLWIGEHGPFAGGWAGQHVTMVPAARAVVVTTGDPGFDPGPPPTDRLAPGWRPARDLIVDRLLPALLEPTPYRVVR